MIERETIGRDGFRSQPLYIQHFIFPFILSVFYSPHFHFSLFAFSFPLSSTIIFDFFELKNNKLSLYCLFYFRFISFIESKQYLFLFSFTFLPIEQCHLHTWLRSRSIATNCLSLFCFIFQVRNMNIKVGLIEQSNLTPFAIQNSSGFFFSIFTIFFYLPICSYYFIFLNILSTIF